MNATLPPSLCRPPLNTSILHVCLLTWCLKKALNDLAIAATLLRDLSEVQRVLIVDLDVHQVRLTPFFIGDVTLNWNRS